MQNSKKLFIFFYFILIIAFFLNLDPNGGAILDFKTHSNIAKNFANDFNYTFNNYEKFSTRHSPILYILISFFYKFEISETLTRLVFFHFALILPYIFFKCIEIKYNNFNSFNNFLFSSLIYVSPTFISLSIWPDSRLFGLIFFTLSIFNYLKFEKEPTLNNAIKCIIFYTLASYLSPNFSLFSIYFLIKFYKQFKFNKELILIIVINFIFSLPAFLYVFSLNDIFFLKSAVPSNNIKLVDYFNIANKVLIILSIIFFYLIPFLITSSIKINNISLRKILIIFFIFAICLINFDYKYAYTGGGIFFKISYFIFKNNFFFYFISLISLIIIVSVFKPKDLNYLLILLIFLANPQYTIYHKYYDPFLLIAFILLFKLDINKIKLFRSKTITIFYIHSLIFLILNFLK